MERDKHGELKEIMEQKLLIKEQQLHIPLKYRAHKNEKAKSAQENSIEIPAVSDLDEKKNEICFEKMASDLNEPRIPEKYNNRKKIYEPRQRASHRALLVVAGLIVTCALFAIALQYLSNSTVTGK